MIPENFARATQDVSKLEPGDEATLKRRELEGLSMFIYDLLAVAKSNSHSEIASLRETAICFHARLGFSRRHCLQSLAFGMASEIRHRIHFTPSTRLIPHLAASIGCS
jgi:hypothetical protein